MKNHEGVEIRLNVRTKGILTKEERETLEVNLWSLLNEVRPDLVSHGLATVIEKVDVVGFVTESIGSTTPTRFGTTVENNVTYSPYAQKDGTIAVARIVDDNLSDYGEENFMYDGEDLCVVSYPTEQEAVDWVNKHIKKELIDPKYLG